ncbi:EAL domain-containing protein [Aquaspirillum sp. LM1]|uniref:EAL domain-containing protein n=1 Tax=Aquaspirillum sp. LM1 TaxID=1938604 RepID=UPI0009840E7B|nr:EAL domain-containing protein [Aquaspirillum sp. LM1]
MHLVKTVRGRLLLAALLVEALMLALLIGNSVRLLYDSLSEQAQRHAEQMSPILNAALMAPLAQRDYATVRAILDESRGKNGITYLAVSDSRGVTVARSGWPAATPLPQPDAVFTLNDKDEGGARYDVDMPITLYGQKLGSLRFGLDLSHIVAARESLVSQGILIALGEIMLSAGLLTLLGLYLTRQLSELTHASEAVARGQLASRLVTEGDDEIGRLGRAFNAMSRAIRDRLDALHASEQRLNLALDGGELGLWDTDFRTGKISVNARCAAMLGETPGQFTPDVVSWQMRAHPEDAHSLRYTAIEHVKGHSAMFECEFRVRHAAGHWVWLLSRGKVVERNQQARAVRMIGTLLDITERKATEARLRLLASVFRYAQEGIMITDADGLILEVNRAYHDITGYSRSAVVGQPSDLLHVDGGADVEIRGSMRKALSDHGHWSGEIVNRRATGELFHEHLSLTMVQDNNGKVLHYIGIFTDISQVKAQQEKLERLARYDMLTSLPNRTLLADRLNTAISLSRRTGDKTGVALIDLDGFKAINDAYGHETGDLVLKEVALRLTRHIRETDTAARLGGDEFVLVLTGLQPGNEVPVLDKILTVLAEPYVLERFGVAANLSASIGLTMYPDDSADADALLRHADQAMYAAKQQGRNRWHAFDPDVDRHVRARFESRERVSEALLNHELVLYYQPQVELSSGKVTGVEALLRWQHPVRGLVSPGEFLPLIEGSEFEVALSRWVIRSVVEQLHCWNQQGISLHISANVPGQHLQSPEFVSQLEGLFKLYPDVPRERLELEILETVALGDMDGVSYKMDACRALGVRFALDDFGTGYASLEYLRRLPADVIKIDRTFVRDMLDDVNDLAIVEGIIALSRAFHRQVVAEGVESSAHYQRLLELGCAVGQGYCIARPMPVEDVVSWMNNWRPDRMDNLLHREELEA